LGSAASVRGKYKRGRGIRGSEKESNRRMSGQGGFGPGGHGDVLVARQNQDVRFVSTGLKGPNQKPKKRTQGEKEEKFQQPTREKIKKAPK